MSAHYKSKGFILAGLMLAQSAAPAVAGSLSAHTVKGAYTPPQQQYIIEEAGRGPVGKITVDCAERFVRVEKTGAGTDKNGHALSDFHETSYDVTQDKYEGRVSSGFWGFLSNGDHMIITNGLRKTSVSIPVDQLCSGMTPLPVEEVPYSRIMQVTGFTK